MEDTQRRHYARVRFATAATLELNGHANTCELLDLSLKGALLQGAAVHDAGPGVPCSLSIRLGDANELVRMDGMVTHREGDRIGLVWQEIDLDSLTHLRRLLELNLDRDASGLERELSTMIGQQRT